MAVGGVVKMKKVSRHIIVMISRILCCIVFLTTPPISAFSQEIQRTSPDFPFSIEKRETTGAGENGLEKLYVFLEEKHFNRKNLQELFAYLSYMAHPTRPLSIKVFTDRKALLSNIDWDKKGVPDYIDTPAGKKARDEIFDKYAASERGYFLAVYDRKPSTEYFSYSLFKNTPGSATVLLKDRQAFVNSKLFLFYSVQSGYVDAVKWILTQNPQLNIKDTQGLTPLIWAVQLHHNEVTKSLISFKADVNMTDAEGMSPLMYAANSENYEGVKLLIENKADVNAQDNGGHTALMFSVIRCNTPITRLLLENGAVTSIKDKSGKTALNYACKDKEMTRLLSAPETNKLSN